MTLEEMQAALDAEKAKNIDIQAALTKANGESADRRKTASELKAQLAAFDGVDMDKYKASLAAAEAAEQERLKGAGKFEEALEKGLAASKAEIESLKGLITGKDAKLEKVLIDNAVLSAIDGKAVNNDHVLKLLRGDIKMDGDSPVVMDGDKIKLDDKGNHMAVGEYAKAWLDENPNHVKAGGSGSGSQGNQGNNNKDAKTIARVDFDALDSVAQAAHCKAGGTITD